MAPRGAGFEGDASREWMLPTDATRRDGTRVSPQQADHFVRNPRAVVRP